MLTFTGSAYQISWKQKIYQVLLKNELSDNTALVYLRQLYDAVMNGEPERTSPLRISATDKGVTMRTQCLVFLLVTFLSATPDAFADWLYPAMKIECDSDSNILIIRNITAYNEAGVQASNKADGIYVPKDTLAEKQTSVEHKCKTRTVEFVVRIRPRFGKIDPEDTFEIEVVRDGVMVLEKTLLDADYGGFRPDSYIRSITVKASGAPIFNRTCRVKELIDVPCR